MGPSEVTGHFWGLSESALSWDPFPTASRRSQVSTQRALKAAGTATPASPPRGPREAQAGPHTLASFVGAERRMRSLS